MAPAVNGLAAVRARIAAAVLPDTAPMHVGAFRLRPRQRDTLTRVHQALRVHGGALLADAAGSGKTVIALAVAAQYGDTLAIVPAAIREQWSRAAARARVPLRIATHDALSHGRLPAAASLVIVDEAHHFRNPATQRYRALAALARGRHLLLLSATPVVNRAADRDALLALFLGSRRVADLALRTAVLVRRSSGSARSSHLVRLPPLAHADDVPGLADAIATLPPPFPAADGRAAAALVRITLAMAWASSVAALDAALRRRQQRGAALADRLADGQWPTRHALALWLHGEDASQLALPFASPREHPAPREALDALRVHIAAVDALRATLAPHLAADTARRARALETLVADEAPRRVLVLAQHAETIRALYRALRHLPGVVGIIGPRVLAASGRWTRDEVIAALGPQPMPPKAGDRLGIRLVLATDILAEGVELQGCATLVHADLAWTPARLEQREGRIAREGQRAEVRVTRFAAPPSAVRLLQLARRLLRKRRVRRAALTPSDDAAALEDLLSGWRTLAPPPDHARVAIVPAGRCAFVAVLAQAQHTSAYVVAASCERGRWRVSTAARDLLSVLRSSERVTAPLSAARVPDAAARELDRQATAMARRVVQRWLRRQRARRLVRGDATLPQPLLRAARRRLDLWVTSQPLAARADAASRAGQILANLSTLRGRGAEQAIRSALDNAEHDAVIAALESAARQTPTTASPPPVGLGVRLEALLILRPTPPAPAPPSACSGTAAPR